MTTAMRAARIMHDLASARSTHPPTPEQAAILSAGKTSSNLMLTAYAGCGKTSTLEMLNAQLTGSCLYLVFNKANAVEAERRMPDTTQVKTFNSIGHRIWSTAIAHKLTLDPKKLNNIVRDMCASLSRAEANEIWAEWDILSQAYGVARSLGYIPAAHQYHERSLVTRAELVLALDEVPEQWVMALFDEILLTSIALAYRGTIDFGDQCYMSAMFGGTYPKFPVVLIDEYQDLSPVQHRMIEKLCKSARQIGVGDDAQSIYGFRGAAAGSMHSAISRFNMRELKLSVSFRCPSEIVRNVHWRVPDFKASREGGLVGTATGDLSDRWSAINPHSSAVICRNNAPLLSLAMQCLANGKSVKLSGVDIGRKLIKELTRLGSGDMRQSLVLGAVEEWRATKLAAESKIANDMADCMKVFASQGRDLAQAIAYAEHLFATDGTIAFMTGHKAKGLEFDHVYHLDPHLCKDTGQDPNVRYVCDTRAKETLTYI